MDDGKLDALGQTIVSALPGAATGHTVAFNQLTIEAEAGKIVEVAKYLRDDPSCRFVNITDITAVDYPGREKRFDVVYHLLSPTLNTRIRIKAEADETTQVPSIIEVFPGADWFERLGIQSTPDQVTVTAGGQHAILVSLLAGTDSGDEVLVEEFAYSGILELCARLGRRARSRGTSCRLL